MNTTPPATQGQSASWNGLLGNKGQCTGVDISQLMIEAARARAARDGVAASFVIADAQVSRSNPSLPQPSRSALTC